MAGLTATFHVKPLQRPRPLLSLSSLSDSKFFLLRLCNPSFFCSKSNFSALRTPISARYGGGGGYSRSGPGNYGRSRQSNIEVDQALDISGIRSNTVRLIDEQQNMVGVVPKVQAFQMAEDAELDLVIVSPDADPPVVRIMDYNKYRYEQQKKKRGQQKKSAANRMDLKELKMGYNIDVHDYSVRLKAARKFLNDGDKVKVIVNLKGRENEFRNNAIELIRRFQNDIGELATEESKNFSVRNIFIVLVPNKNVVQKAPDPPKKKERPAVNEVSASI
ncbi:translation initiation factor IF3-4, chloroplastic [Diospyros lotus]|uniref:translation initiation factor IF3-4, chloroplastic n=1 Tax=Diospyros lotus TaxID=55363 RepID=UPI00224C84C6|nr:translation initiation factor IF3-4, chloroplastic [Diospyros lotus]XP_052200316.1 translation initiation factor IF3-4, chloroplastic [Diospyros lotus]